MPSRPSPLQHISPHCAHRHSMASRSSSSGNLAVKRVRRSVATLVRTRSLIFTNGIGHSLLKERPALRRARAVGASTRNCWMYRCTVCSTNCLPTQQDSCRARAFAAHHMICSPSLTSEGVDRDAEHATPGPSRPAPSCDASLWVDRYRPRRFTDLLGDDRVHREVMAWVKEWDYCVFGRRQGRGQKRRREEDTENLDEWRRPREKASTRLHRDAIAC